LAARPIELGLEDVRAYQVHLASKGVAWASLNQAGCALRFFYGVTLGEQTIPERIAQYNIRPSLWG
jgi:integrase/recombinase XerD